MKCSFFKCSFIKRAGAFIFKLDGGKIYNIVKFKFQSMSCEIEGAFEKRTKFARKNLQKYGPKGHKSSKQKGPAFNTNFLTWGINTFFVRLYPCML